MLTQAQIDAAVTKAVHFMAQPGIEGIRLTPYLCPAGKPTIGIGSTFYENGAKVSLKDPAITQERAFKLAEALVKTTFLPQVLKLWPSVETSNQLAALISFAYNVGAANLASSTLLKKLLAGDVEEAADQFLVWTKGTDPKTGKKIDLPGLVTRRGLERTLFNTPD